MAKKDTKNKAESNVDKKTQFWVMFNRYFTVFVILNIAIVGGIFYTLFYSGTLDKIEQTKVQIQNRENDISIAQRQLDEIKDLIAQYEALSPEDLDRIEKALPTGASLENAMVQMQKLAARNGINIITMDMSKEAIGKNTKNSAAFIGGLAGMLPETVSASVNTGTIGSKLRRVNVSLRVSGGSYLSIKSFLESLEKHLRISDVSGFAYSPLSEEYVFTLKMYYLGE